MNTNTATEIVQDESTNNLHLRGDDKADGTPTALCNKRYRVFTYATEEAQAGLRFQWETYGSCSRCEAKA